MKKSLTEPAPIPSHNLARMIVEPYTSKPLTRTASTHLVNEIDAAIRLRVDQMHTYGPEEVARIAHMRNLTEDQVRGVLSSAGGECVDADGMARVWRRSIGGELARDILGETRAKMTEIIKSLLHASRDGMRNIGHDTTTTAFRLHGDGGYMAEAMGIRHALVVLGYGYFGIVTGDDPNNLSAWFNRLEDEVLAEEGFRDGTHACSRCLAKYGKDKPKVRA